MGAVDVRAVVLVVDDDDDHVMMLEASFESVGYAVITAHSFAEASAKLRANHVDALVADLTLGDGSALDLLRPLGADRPRFAVVLSGYDRPEDRERAQSAGYDAHLVKPMPFEQLTSLLADGLRKRSSGVQLAKTRGVVPDDLESSSSFAKASG